MSVKLFDHTAARSKEKLLLSVKDQVYKYDTVTSSKEQGCFLHL